MRKFLIIASAVLALGACKKDKWEKAISEMEGFKDRMCKCTDQKCADEVEKDMDKWMDGMKDTIGKDEKPPKEIDERGDKAEKEMRACKKKLRKDEAPAAPPAAPAEGAPPAGDKPATPPSP